MLFETCWFYLKKYQIKKYTEHKDCYSFFFNFNPFQANVPRNLKDFSVLWGACRNQPGFLKIRSCGWFLYELQDCRGHRTSRNFDLWINVFARLDTVAILY